MPTQVLSPVWFWHQTSHLILTASPSSGRKDTRHLQRIMLLAAAVKGGWEASSWALLTRSQTALTAALPPERAEDVLAERPAVDVQFYLSQSIAVFEPAVGKDGKLCQRGPNRWHGESPRSRIWQGFSPELESWICHAS